MTDSSCLVRWDAAEGATDYDVNYKRAVGGTWTNEPHKGTRLYTTIYDLEPNTEYRWAARAENSDGPSEWVFGPNFTTLEEETDETTADVGADGQAPPEPTNLRFEAVTDSSCTVRWDAAAGATDYDVNYKPAVGGRWTNEPHSGTGLYNTINDLAPDTEYRWAVRAENGEGRSEWVFGPNFTTLPEEEEGEAPEEVADDTPVTIPDANLRAAIAAELGKASDATITKGEMTILLRLEVNFAGISDLTGLEFATNLTWVQLVGNSITDISALSSLTNLTWVQLVENSITDISALSSLTNLDFLNLNGNEITDISALSGLTNLTGLSLNGNEITDISALSGLTNLTWLSLRSNNISDVSALAGLARLTGLYLNDNPLNASSINGHIPALQNRGVTVEFDPTPVTDDLTPVTDDPTPVTIPDAKLRAAIAAKLGKASDATITKGEMSALLRLNKENAGISDLTGLEFATNLRNLKLGDNEITDISALSDLTYLTWLGLNGNEITDISALSDLTYLTSLYLQINEITDISALSGLTNLTELWLDDNRITDISALSGLTNLTELGLRLNLLSVSSIEDHIPALERSGATVHFDPPFLESDFRHRLELVFLSDHFTEKQERTFRYAARRWMSIIRKDLPDYKFTQGWSGNCGDQPYEIPSGERIDDLRIYVGSVERMEVRIHVGNEEVVYESRAQAGPDLLRETFLPVLGCVTVNSKFFDSFTSIDLLGMSLHEMGHVLGIGTTGFRESGFLRDSSDGPYFNGPRAIAAFDDAGGRNYTGAKVPLEKSGGHWRSPVLEDELMSSRRGISMLSAITIQALADLGYVVDVTQADSYTLPRTVAKPSAKVAAHSTHAQPEWSCRRRPTARADLRG